MTAAIAPAGVSGLVIHLAPLGLLVLLVLYALAFERSPFDSSPPMARERDLP